ncbi:MAG: hypothetical protein M1834_003939 [Cirrosporium novae-zelandiae]|nr:MAG: hypothetical protein M1834_003939 [Cirrosporium novae-zelandiae]
MSVSSFPQDSTPSSDSLALRVAEGSLPQKGSHILPLEEQEKLVVQLRNTLHSQEHQNETNSALDDGDPATDQTRQNMTVIRTILDQLWASSSSSLAGVATELANASRDPQWRKPFGNAGILDFFLEVIATDKVQNDLALQSLRVIGNSCADIDENRQRVISRQSVIPIIFRCRDQALVQVAVPVLYNICNDYEPAHEQIALNGVYNVLLRVLQTNPEISDSPVVEYVYRLMEIVTAQPQWLDHSAGNAVEGLLEAVQCKDLDQLVSISNIVCAHLRNERFQKLAIDHDAVQLVWNFLASTYSQNYQDGYIEDKSRARNSQLSFVRVSLTGVLSDISFLPEFSQHYPLDSVLIGTLRESLSKYEKQLQICACIMLGNISRSDSICQRMVDEFRVPNLLLKIIRESDDSELLYAATSFLKNLAIPKKNKGILCACGVIEDMPRLWTFETVPQLQLTAVGLTRQLITGGPGNIGLRIAFWLPNDMSQMKYLDLGGGQNKGQKTYLTLLLTLFRKTDDLAIKVEIGRTVTAIFRCLYASPDKPVDELDEPGDMIKHIFQLDKDVAEPIKGMVLQDKWPVIRSEGWFALGLIARSDEGTLSLSDLLRDVSLFKALEERVMGGGEEETAEQKAMKEKDRDNALVMLKELLERQANPNVMPESCRSLFQDLLEGRYHGLSDEELKISLQGST